MPKAGWPVRDAGDEPAPSCQRRRAAAPGGSRRRGSAARPTEVSWPVVALMAWLAGVVALWVLGFLRYGHSQATARARPATRNGRRMAADSRRAGDPGPHSARGKPRHGTGPLLVCRRVSPGRPESLWAGLEPAERAAILRHELEHLPSRRPVDDAPGARPGGSPLVQSAGLVGRRAIRGPIRVHLRPGLGAPATRAAFAATLLRLGSGCPGPRSASFRLARAAGACSSESSGFWTMRPDRLAGNAPCRSPWRSWPLGRRLCGSRPSARPTRMPGRRAARAMRLAPNRLCHPAPCYRSARTTCEIRSSFITGIAFSPDGRLIAAAEANAAVPRVSLFDVRTGRLVKLISPPDRPRGWVQCVAFSPDQTKLVWGEISGQVALWDLTRDRLLFREKLHGNGVSDVTFSPDGQIMASGGEDGAVHLRRAEILETSFRSRHRRAATRAPGFTGLPPAHSRSAPSIWRSPPTEPG